MRIVPITFHDWLVAFLLTLALELPLVVWLARKLEPRAGRRASAAAAGNALTHPFVWFVFPALGFGWPATTALSETWAVLAEASLYLWLLATARPGSALLVSLAANLASFGLGLLLWALS